MKKIKFWTFSLVGFRREFDGNSNSYAHEPCVFLHHYEFPKLNISLRRLLRILFRQAKHRRYQLHLPFQVELPVNHRHYPKHIQC